MNYQRLQQLDKEKLIVMVLEKDKQLEAFIRFVDAIEKLGKLCIDGKYYWIWSERIK